MTRLYLSIKASAAGPGLRALRFLIRQEELNGPMLRFSAGQSSWPHWTIRPIPDWLQTNSCATRPLSGVVAHAPCSAT